MKKKILVIDDSALMRRVLSDIINSDERFQVTDFAANGLAGLELLQDPSKTFDAVLLDINMPKMNGIELLKELKERNIKATIIIVSTIAKRDAAETITALELGAFDFIKKPESFVEVKSNSFSDRILTCLTAATQRKENGGSLYFPLPSEEARRKPKEELAATSEDDGNVQATREIIQKLFSSFSSQGNQKLVAIACSTGGPKALHTVIPKLPANLDAGVLIVQHMPGGFTKSLADRLNELSQIIVKEAEDGEPLRKGIVYIAKGGYQMRVKKQNEQGYILSVTKEQARHGLLPCADIMYESLLGTEYDQITCVVLTGMGGDGTAGIKQLKKSKKIYVIAQNEETSIVYGMPKVVRDAGLVDEVVALEDVSDAIIKNVGVC